MIPCARIDEMSIEQAAISAMYMVVVAIITVLQLALREA